MRFGHLAMLVDGRLTESDLWWHRNLAVPAKFEVMVPVPVGKKIKNVSLETRDAVGSGNQGRLFKWQASVEAREQRAR